jgi:arylsulfatase A-like enzyme
MIALLLLLGCQSEPTPAPAPEPRHPQRGEPAPEPGGTPPGATPPRGAVQPGAGTTTHAPPEQTQPASDGALCPGCDIVLITVCSLRQDHVSAYGEPHAQTPAIDQIATGGYRFTRAYAASNFTLASLTAVLTGRFGSSTGVTGWDRGLVRDIYTLPEVLGLYGYRTAAFTTDAPSGFRPDYGLDRGFQRMEITQPPRGTPDGRFRGGSIGEPGETAAPVVKWLSVQGAEDPLFVMFHSRTAHFPFVTSRDGTRTDETGMTMLLWEAGAKQAQKQAAMPGMAGGTAQQGIVEFGPDPLHVRVQELGQPAVDVWRQRYAEGVGRMDADVQQVLDALEARGRLDQTIIALVADHGESLNDHEELLHGDAYFDSVIRVPLLLRVPGLPGGVIDGLVSQVDLMPTLLSLVGAVPPAGIDGTPLTPLLLGEAESVRGTAISEGGVSLQAPDRPDGAVISPPWALLRQQRGCGPGSPPPADGTVPTCLFHLDDDPTQLSSVATAHPEVVEELLGRWSGFRARAVEADHLELSPEFIEELQRNGYDFRLGTPP